jgi:hypothetical protein
VHPACCEPVEQGICPTYYGRKSACSFKHFQEVHEDHGFVHPGFIAPGDTCVVPLALNATLTPSEHVVKQERKRKSPSAKALSPVSPSAAATARDDKIDQIVIAHEAIVAAARKSDLPTAWMRVADAVPQPDFISIFDGASGMLHTLASRFGLKGTPPVDKASKSVPLDV